MDLNKIIGQGIFFFMRARAYSVSAALSLFVVLAPIHAETPKDLADLNNADLKVKYAALENMKTNSTPATTAALVSAALQETDVRFTMALLDQISVSHHDRVIPQLAPLLRHKNKVIRHRTAVTIGLLGGNLAEKPLLDALKREREPEVSAALLQALSVCGSEQSVDAIRAELSNSKPQVRANAIHALGRIPGKKADASLRGHREKDPALKKRWEEAVDRKAKETKETK